MNDGRSVTRNDAGGTAGANRGPNATPTPLDDDTIGGIVRAVADDWTLPALRLDEAGWRERVRSPWARRLGTARTTLRQGAALVGAAVVLTIVAAVAGALLSSPRGLLGIGAASPSPAPSASMGGVPSPTPGDSARPSAGATVRPTPTAAPTALPRLFVDGAAPVPSMLLMQRQDGGVATVDLTTGVLHQKAPDVLQDSSATWGSGGAVICLCATGSGFELGGYTSIVYRLDTFDDTTSGHVVARIEGIPDPRDVAAAVPDSPPHALVHSRFSADGRYGFIGWSARQADGWHEGLIVIDVAAGTEVVHVDLPVLGLGEGDTRNVLDAPIVVGEGSTDLVVARGWSTESTTGPASQGFTQGADAWRVPFSNGNLGRATALAGATDCGDWIDLGGMTSDGGSWIGCHRPNVSETVVRRLDGNGATVGDTALSLPGGIEGDTWAVSPDGRFVYFWDPLGRVLTRVSLETGDKASVAAEGAQVDDGPMGALGVIGRWLVPTARAKMILHAGLVISPDGERAYALGINGGPGGPSGSSGVDVFSTTLEPLGHWDATADFVSLAVSDDGATIYAAGMPGVTADGRASDQPASVTTFDVEGRIRAIAGDLGDDILVFASSLAR